MSDVLGTLILLAVTVTLVAVAAVQVRLATEGVDEPAGRLDVRLTADAGDDYVSLLHVGGDIWDRGDLRVLVVVDGVKWYDADLGAAGTPWALGESVRVTPLAGTLAAGARVEVVVAARAQGVGLADLRTRVAAPGAGPGAVTFSVDLWFDNGRDQFTPSAPDSVIVHANVSHSLGRKNVHSVIANLSDVNGSPEALMRDDGTAGDVVAGDGNFSAILFVSEDLAGTTRTLTVTATDFDGNVRTDTGTLIVRTPEQTFKYNTSLVERAGLRLFKYEAGSHDQLTAQLKVQMEADPITVNGYQWTLSKAYFHFDSFKTGSSDSPLIMDSFDAEPGPATWACHDVGARVKVFRAENRTIQQFDVNRDVLYHYVEVEWKRTDASTTFRETITSNARDEYLVLKRSETYKETRDDDWPSTFVDCNP